MPHAPLVHMQGPAGHAPASAIFATNARYKREAFRGSEFAARILNQNGLKVVMKVDRDHCIFALTDRPS